MPTHTNQNLTIDLKELAAHHFKYLKMVKAAYDKGKVDSDFVNSWLLTQKQELLTGLRGLLRIEAFMNILADVTVKEYQANSTYYDDKVHALKESLLKKYKEYLDGFGEL